MMLFHNVDINRDQAEYSKHSKDINLTPFIFLDRNSRLLHRRDCHI